MDFIWYLVTEVKGKLWTKTLSKSHCEVDAESKAFDSEITFLAGIVVGANVN